MLAYRDMDKGLEEPISSILWATPRIQSDIPELVVISDQLAIKYGKEYLQSCRQNALHTVNEKLVHKLGVQAPPPLLVNKYLEEIARSYNVPYVPKLIEHEGTDLLLNVDDDSRRGGNNNVSGGGGTPAFISREQSVQPNAPYPNVMQQQSPFQYPPPTIMASPSFHTTLHGQLDIFSKHSRVNI